MKKVNNFSQYSCIADAVRNSRDKNPINSEDVNMKEENDDDSILDSSDDEANDNDEAIKKLKVDKF